MLVHPAVEEGIPPSPRAQVTIHPPPALSLMHRTQSHPQQSERLKRKKGLRTLVMGLSHSGSRPAARRLCRKLGFWMWRKRREKCRLSMLRAKKRVNGTISGSCLSVETQSRENKGQVIVSPLCCDTGSSGDTNVSAGSITAPAATALSPKTDPSACLSGITEPLKSSFVVKPVSSTERDTRRSSAHFKELRTLAAAPGLEEVVHDRSGHLTAGPRGQERTANINTDERINRKKAASSQTDLKALKRDIHEFLDDFHRAYGSFIPLEKSDVLRHLKRRFNTDFSGWRSVALSEAAKYQTVSVQRPVPSFRVVYKKHTLTLDDLSTLADQNWLNDQVMNMYGELIVDSVDGKVHFLNSFFHRQLMTKGYDGVKRWTKKVDLFSKRLLLVPIHLEVHWCLVTADTVQKKVCLHDSQGNALQKVARNVLKYVMAEAKEKKQRAFESGWVVSYDDEKIPQQTNENDCGVFVLEYSRCLALGKPLQFSQKDIPKIRRRIYKELCDCKLHEQA